MSDESRMAVMETRIDTLVENDKSLIDMARGRREHEDKVITSLAVIINNQDLQRDEIKSATANLDAHHIRISGVERRCTVMETNIEASRRFMILSLKLLGCVVALMTLALGILGFHK